MCNNKLCIFLATVLTLCKSLSYLKWDKICILISWLSAPHFVEVRPPISLLLGFVSRIVSRSSVVSLRSADRLQLAPAMDQNNLPVSRAIISWESDGLKARPMLDPAPSSHLVSPDSISRTAALMQLLDLWVHTPLPFPSFHYFLLFVKYVRGLVDITCVAALDDCLLL